MVSDGRGEMKNDSRVLALANYRDGSEFYWVEGDQFGFNWFKKEKSKKQTNKQKNKREKQELSLDWLVWFPNGNV